ncbi:MAG: YggS family pyridoxal phosphate-dependent enzyme [Melioribacteraceae bacterium]|nr:YggS family pyridoxal phosphate-dependent enzyme [Melioribacteraceae bacterium]MCO6472204.1 YggS family pyridoxal phosphate-dependent enzyme [Melioribacteraceae bacterium]MDD3557446.1 YggS family pyridoxal phosphate-dependent enzyme [Melioribacteraceae bacterium]
MISTNLNKVQDQIFSKCSEIGRDSNDITLIAVSKTQSIETISDVYRIGQRHFGENKAQELRDKGKELNLDITWHFIGHLQKNKAKYAVEFAEYIHSVDSIQLLDEIDKQALKFGKVQKFMIEANTSGEESKYGIENFNKIVELAEYSMTLKNVEFSGLMTMAPFVDDETIIRNSFKVLKEHFDKLKKNGFDIKHLSMGMTNDYLIALEEGATMLRIGTALFGERNYN